MRRTGARIRNRLIGSLGGSIYGYFSSTLPTGSLVGSYVMVGMALFIISFILPVVTPIIFALNYGRRRRTLLNS
jgi:hypothetical protein